jgi:hypothetical protein
MSQGGLDVNNILREALGWKVDHKATPLAVRAHILRLAHDNGHKAWLVDDSDTLEIRFLTGESIWFDGQQWHLG